MSNNVTPIRDGIVQPPPPTDPPEPSAWALIGTAQDELRAAAGLCRAGALALAAAAKPDIPAALPEVQKTIAGVVESALKGLPRALNALAPVVEEDDADVIMPIFNVCGLLLVIQSALSADEPVGGRGLVDDPIAGSLETAADTLGEDCEQGLSARCAAMLTKLRDGVQH